MVLTTLAFLVAVLATAANIGTALAALYPTTPVSTTVFHAGRKEFVTWIDDGRKPRLNELSLLDIELCTADGEYISPLSRNVEPRNRRHMVDIPAELPFGSHNYTILFTSVNPNTTIYTADFLIATNNYPTPVLVQLPTPVVLSSSTITGAHAYLTFVLPNETITTQVADEPTGREVPEATIYAEPLTKSTVDRSATRGARASLDKAKFRFVFVLWPALVGISMAL